MTEQAVPRFYEVGHLPNILAPIVLGFTGFFMPMSSTFNSIGLVAVVALCLLTPFYRQQLLALLSSAPHWLVATSGFFVLVLGACLWSDAPLKDEWIVVSKYSKLLYLPMLTILFVDKRLRFIGLHALLAGVACIAMLSLLSYYHWIHCFAAPDNVFRNHIIMGFMGACGLYMSTYCMLTTPKRYWVWVYFALSLLFGFHLMWVNGGRVAYGLGLFLILYLCWEKRQHRASFWLLIGLFIALLGLLQASTVGQARLGHLHQEWQTLWQTTEGSVKSRIEFHQLAKNMLYHRPMVGYGTAGFGEFVTQHQLFPYWEGRLREPHSQYWLIAAEFGGLGLIVFAVMMGAIWAAICHSKEMRMIGTGVCLAFCLNQLTDSMLFYSPGYFFIFIMAMCLGEAHENAI